MHAIIRDGTPEQVGGGGFTDNAGIRHPGNVLRLWSDAELAAIDVYPVADASVPDGHVVTGSTLTWDGESITRVFTSEPAPPPTLDDYRDAIQAHVDAAAVSRDYANAVSLASYAASTNAAWAAESAAFIAWRDAVWAYVYAQLALVQSGDRVQPTAAELVAELPAIVWPEGSPE